MTFLSKLWPGLSLAIIAVLIFFLVRGCGPNHVPAAPSSGVNHDYDSAKAADSPVIAALSRERDSLRDRVDTLVADLVASQSDLQERAGDLSRTMAALDQARANRDTIQQLHRGDTLEAEVKAGIPAVAGFAQLTDSLVAAYVARGQVQDSIIAKLARLNRVADTTISRQRLYYEILNKDDVHKTAQLKIYKPVAVGGAAVVIGFILLKIIAH